MLRNVKYGSIFLNNSAFSEGDATDFHSVQKKDQVLSFLNTRIKGTEIDPDKRWIRTWNDYLQRIKYFFRWLYNKRKPEVTIRESQKLMD
jgi:hypothetical protein